MLRLDVAFNPIKYFLNYIYTNRNQIKEVKEKEERPSLSFNFNPIKRSRDACVLLRIFALGPIKYY